MKNKLPFIWAVLIQGNLNFEDTFATKAEAVKQAKALRAEYAPASAEKRRALFEEWQIEALKPSDIKVVRYAVQRPS